MTDADSKVKRNKGKNWPQEDKILIVEIIEEYKGIIENNATNSKNNDDKNKAWAEIEQKFNKTSMIKRKVEALRQTYSTLKINAKKEKAAFKVCRHIFHNLAPYFRKL